MTTQSIIDRAFALCEEWDCLDAPFVAQSALWEVFYDLEEAGEITLHHEDDDAYFMGENGEETYVSDLWPELEDMCIENRGKSQNELDMQNWLFNS